MADTLSVTDMLPNKFEPKRKFRWVFAIEGIDAFLMKTAARPTYTTEEVAIPWINHHRYVAGKTTFGTMSVTLHDPIAPSGAQQVMEWVRTHFESVSGRAGYADFYKRDCQLKLLDPVGTVVELWDIKGAFLTEANFNDLSYDGSDLVEIAVEKGKSQNKHLKLGICGEHGGDPKSIEFCSKVGLNYVSCSPYRVPIARLAAAQAELKK